MLLDDKGRLFGRLSLLDVGIAGGFLLVLSPLLFLARVADHAAFRIYTVDPPRFVAGRDKVLDVMVTGAPSSGRAYTIPFPLPNAVVPNEARYSIPLHGATPSGPRSLIIQNLEGKLTWRENAFEVVWQPEIHAVHPNRLSVGSRRTFAIKGKYFDPKCKVVLDNQPIGRNYLHVIRPDRIEVRKFLMNFKPGKYSIRVTNPQGLTAVLAEAIEVFSPPPPPTRRFVPLIVTCAVQEPSATALQIIKPGTIISNERETVVGKVLHARLSPLAPTGLQTTVAKEILVATLLLAGEIVEAEEKRSYFFGEHLMLTGGIARLVFHFERPYHAKFAAKSIVLMEPRLAPGRARELLGLLPPQPNSEVLDEQ